MRIPLIEGGEYDVLTGWRRVLKYTKRPGVCKRIKNQYNRRLRKTAREQIAEQLQDG